MATISELKESAAAERQQHLDIVAAKDQIIADRDATITDLQNQLANAIKPEDLDGVKSDIEGIVP